MISRGRTAVYPYARASRQRQREGGADSLAGRKQCMALPGPSPVCDLQTTVVTSTLVGPI